MRPITEWLITAVGGIIDGGIGLVIGCGVAALVASVNPFNFVVMAFCWLGMMLLGCYGAMIGGNAAGRFLDRRNSQRGG
jgi:hypothetical protein